MAESAVAGILAVLVLAASGLAAEETAPPAGPRREIRGSIGTAVNPLGLQNGADVLWRWSLSKSSHPLRSDAHLTLGLASRLSPAYERLGAFIEIAPLSVLDVRVGLEPVFYFGTFNSMLGFSGYEARFDDAARDALRAQGRATAGLAGRAYLAPTAKIKVGRLIARTHAELEWWKARQPGAPFFYEPTRDTLLDARGDAMMTAETLVVYELSRRPGRKVLAGPVHTLTRVYHAAPNQKQDLGLMAIVGLGRSGLGMTEPTLFAKVFWYLEDPYRRHQVGAQLALGFGLGR
jgi:hypothetical protein